MLRVVKIAFILMLMSSHVSANDKIVFIDINYIFKNSNAGKDLHAQIKQRNEALTLEINKIKNQIEDERKKILSQKNVLSIEEYNKKVGLLEAKISEFNSTVSNKQKEFTLFKNKIENNFSKSLNTLLEEFSSKNSINIILKRENLLMAKKDLDITQTIFELFNKRISKIKIE
tara:strand:- start:732 stop:1250 length:519 start_codon:yes stop_codon:yes gene_type:complete